MAENSGIQWTSNTWNPWHGCHKVSSGCKYCYMMRDKEKYGQNGDVVKRSKTKFNDPLKWKDPCLCFTCSWSDWFIEEADQWRDEAWAIIKATPHITYQILTKRPERIKDHLPGDWGEGYDNVWIGVSVENQKAAEVRVPLLLDVPAAVRFLSCEPLLSAIDLRLGEMTGDLISWVIIGGESGNDEGRWLYRPCELPWIQSLISQCFDFDIPVFVKQMGTYIAKQNGYKDRHGGHMAEWPIEFMKRDFPKTV